MPKEGWARLRPLGTFSHNIMVALSWVRALLSSDLINTCHDTGHDTHYYSLPTHGGMSILEQIKSYHCNQL